MGQPRKDSEGKKGSERKRVKESEGKKESERKRVKESELKKAHQRERWGLGWGVSGSGVEWVLPHRHAFHTYSSVAYKESQLSVPLPPTPTPESQITSSCVYCVCVCVCGGVPCCCGKSIHTVFMLMSL